MVLGVFDCMLAISQKIRFYLSNCNICTAISDFLERILLQPQIQVTLNFLINKQYLVVGLTAYNDNNSHGVFPHNRHV